MLGKYGRDENQENINRGIVLGKKLGRKLQIRNESRMTTFTRKNSGKIDKRLLAELGFGNSDVFQQTFVDSYSNTKFVGTHLNFQILIQLIIFYQSFHYFYE
jgi:hypothetical protein